MRRLVPIHPEQSWNLLCALAPVPAAVVPAASLFVPKHAIALPKVEPTFACLLLGLATAVATCLSVITCLRLPTPAARLANSVALLVFSLLITLLVNLFLFEIIQPGNRGSATLEILLLYAFAFFVGLLLQVFLLPFTRPAPALATILFVYLATLLIIVLPLFHSDPGMFQLHAASLVLLVLSFVSIAAWWHKTAPAPSP